MGHFHIAMSKFISLAEAMPEELYAWKTGTVIQEAMPRLNADEREFVMTGITPEEWNFHLGEEE